MKSTPLIFRPDMVRAILAGHKTQFRTPLKANLDNHAYDHHGHVYGEVYEPEYKQIKSPYGYKGDMIWVKEQWRPLGDGGPSETEYLATTNNSEGEWKNPLFMPKKRCRLKLKVADIAIESIYPIDEYEAIAEGIEIDPYIQERIDSIGRFVFSDDAVWRDYLSGGYDLKPGQSFFSLWQSIHRKKDMDMNMQVWVICFDVSWAAEF